VAAYTAALRSLRDGALRRLPGELTSWWAALPEELRWSKDVGERLRPRR
jgi:hypothetical protein